MGSALTRELLHRGTKSVRVLDTDEHGLFKLRRSLGASERNRLRLLLGDVRDYGRVRLAIHACDTVFHLAAIKNMEISEFNPIETCRTNIAGTSTLVEAALEARPSRFIFVSSDKAVHHTSLYGASKFCGEQITLWANKIQDFTKYSVVRPPNFKQSRGNVFEVWDEEIAQGKPLSVTDPEMRRWFIDTGVMAKELVRVSLIMQGGEIFVPKGKQERIMDLIPPGSKIKIIGKRPGEKLAEILMTKDEESRAVDLGSVYRIEVG